MGNLNPSPTQIRDAMLEHGVPLKLYRGWDTIGREWAGPDDSPGSAGHRPPHEHRDRHRQHRGPVARVVRHGVLQARRELADRPGRRVVAPVGRLVLPSRPRWPVARDRLRSTPRPHWQPR